MSACLFLSMKIGFSTANSADPDEMLHYVLFFFHSTHLGILTPQRVTCSNKSYAIKLNNKELGGRSGNISYAHVFMS